MSDAALVGAPRRRRHRPATSRRCWPSPTACAAATRRSTITVARHPGGARGQARARSAATACASIPKVPLPRRPKPRPAPTAGQPQAGRRRRPATRSATTTRRSSSASAVTSRRPPTSPPAASASLLVIHEQNTTPGLANRLGARFATPRWPRPSPRPGCRGAADRNADPARDRDPGPRRPPGGGAGALRPRPTDGPPCWSPAARSVPCGSTPRSPSGSLSLCAAGVQVLHVTGPGKPFEPGATAGCALPALRDTDRMDLAYSVARPRRRPGRRQHRLRARRGGPPRPSTSRCRSATASSGSTPPTSWPPGEGCSSRTRDLTPEWVDAALRAAPRPTPSGSAAMGSAAAAHGHSRRPTSTWPTSSRGRGAPRRCLRWRTASTAGSTSPRRSRPRPTSAWCTSSRIGGSGVSAVARLFLGLGVRVSGSDAARLSRAARARAARCAGLRRTRRGPPR